LVSNAPKSHILNFYENFDLPLSSLKSAFFSLLEGNFPLVEEKIDGQNLTFTVRNGKVEKFYKGASWTRVSQGGDTIEMLENSYSGKETVKNAFLDACKSLQILVNAFPNLSERLFQNGKVVVNAEIVIIDNLNTIPYSFNCICLFSPHLLDPEASDVDFDAYEEFVYSAAKTKLPIPVRKVPKLCINPAPDLLRSEVCHSLESFIKLVPDGSTVGDLVTFLVKKEIVSSKIFDKFYLQDHVIDEISRRIALESPKFFTYARSQKINPRLWFDIQKLEDNHFRDIALKDFEMLFHKLAQAVFKNLEFKIASNNPNDAKFLIDFVNEVKSAIADGEVRGSRSDLQKAEIFLSKIDTQTFEKPVEGIVFKWENELYKLTGVFTPINKLRGLFCYGKNPLRMI